MSNSAMVFTTRMPAGFPGSLTRPDEATVETQAMSLDAPVTAFGLPVKMVGGKVAPLEAGDTEDAVYGFLVRVFPTVSGDLSASFDGAAPNPHQLHSVMTRGYMSVVCAAGTPDKGGQVYVRLAPGSGNAPLGQIESAAVSGETVALPHCIFTGSGDAQGVTEIRLWR
jgi:hypothetical protein